MVNMSSRKSIVILRVCMCMSHVIKANAIVNCCDIKPVLLVAGISSTDIVRCQGSVFDNRVSGAPLGVHCLFFEGLLLAGYFLILAPWLDMQQHTKFCCYCIREDREPLVSG